MQGSMARWAQGGQGVDGAVVRRESAGARWLSGVWDGPGIEGWQGVQPRCAGGMGGGRLHKGGEVGAGHTHARAPRARAPQACARTPGRTSPCPLPPAPQVNQNLIRCLTVEPPQPEEKLAMLSEIAQVCVCVCV